ncbi:hypothetical protein Y1Q_0024335 [Alligator mississippiensis]|uniref:Uncharacterized protein n=1 Tax=Alligator mississippiensis TaxID=8496 RepID=A0A151NJG4_ALLMI|nr:hypothetical protein Y1Q_0024335 [Alligator mississippiensis]
MVEGHDQNRIEHLKELMSMSMINSVRSAESSTPRFTGVSNLFQHAYVLRADKTDVRIVQSVFQACASPVSQDLTHEHSLLTA